MWCKQCQQDVPAVASDEGGFCCSRCARRHDSVVAEPVDQPRTADESPVAASASYDDWEVDEQLRHIGRVLEKGSREAKSAFKADMARIDPPHGGPAQWHPQRTSARKERGREQSQTAPALTAAVWASLALGTMVLVCGGILMGWSIFSGRPELWNVGLPVAACGQVALLIGLILQLDRLWHGSRNTASKLDQVDEQLHDLKATTTMLGAAHSSPSSAFYSHLIDGAAPQLLLTDLKSQLDLLALKLGQQDR